jgi:NADH-quinone oxidoreductase subunit N
MYVPMVLFVALATMTVGNLAAISQNNTKRLLAYSSIAHVGFMLLGLLATTATGVKGILMYLLVYTFMNLGAFGVITSLRRRNIIGDQLDDISGLWFKAPREALLMLVFLLSLAGVPPLAGFYGKYFIFLSLIESGNLASTEGAAGSAKMFYVLATVAVLYVAISLYYYLRIANAMFMRPAMDTEPVKSSPGMQLALAVTAIATIGIGVMPEWFIRLTEWSLGLARAGAVALR